MFNGIKGVKISEAIGPDLEEVEPGQIGEPQEDQGLYPYLYLLVNSGNV